MTPPFWLVIIGLDRVAWIRWLVVAILLVPVLIGYGILLGHHYVVIRRNTPGSPR
jgi:hypothetical protein